MYLLKWSHFHVDKHGQKTCQGNECSVCFYCRRRYMIKGTEQQTLIAEKKKCPELAAKFVAWRKDKVQGTYLFTDEIRIDVKAFVESVRKTYSQAKRKGNFYHLEDFAEKEGLKYDDEDEFVLYVVDHYGYKRGKGKTGRMGVWEPTTSKGVAYEYEEGLEDATAMKMQEASDTIEAVRERYAQKLKEGIGSLIDRREAVMNKSSSREALPDPQQVATVKREGSAQPSAPRVRMTGKLVGGVKVEPKSMQESRLPASAEGLLRAADELCCYLRVAINSEYIYKATNQRELDGLHTRGTKIGNLLAGFTDRADTTTKAEEICAEMVSFRSKRSFLELMKGKSNVSFVAKDFTPKRSRH